MKVTAKAHAFATGYKTISSSEPVFNPYKGQPKNLSTKGNTYKDIIKHNTQGRTTPEGISDPVKEFLDQNPKCITNIVTGKDSEVTTPNTTQVTNQKPPNEDPPIPKYQQ
jgi:hypothetical protein